MSILSGLLGSVTAERALLLIAARDETYANEIAEVFGMNRAQAGRKLERLERDGILVHRTVGKTKLFELNPRFALKKELLALLNGALDKYPKALQDELRLNRRRPRRTGKSLRKQ